MSKKEWSIPDFMEELYVQAGHVDRLTDADFLHEIQEQEIERVLSGEPGAEFRALATLAKFVMWGAPIQDNFQSIINLIVAKALFKGRLPQQKIGRPKLLYGVNGTEVAEWYLALMASGVGYAEAVTSLAEKYNKSERQIMRIVEENRIEVEAMQEIEEASTLNEELAEVFSQLKAMKEQKDDHRRRRLDPDFMSAEDQRLIAEIDLRIKGFRVTTDTK